MAQLNNHYLKSFTLIETLVALVLVMLSFGIATTIFINVQQSNKSAMRLKANLEMESIMTKAGAEQLFLDNRYDHDGFYVEKTCYPYQEGGNAIVVILESFNLQKVKIAERKEILINHNP